MMKVVYRFSVLVLLLVALVQCDDVLQVEEPKAVDAERVFNDPVYAELFLNNLYGLSMPGWGARSNVLMTEESIGRNSQLDGAVEDIATGTGDNSLGNYSYETFRQIRNINSFIEQVGEGEIEEEIANPLIGQALFLRAWVYWGLVKDYGGIPIVNTVLDNNDDLPDDLPRASAAACVDFIVSDLDLAISKLGTYDASDYGRITKSAAAALKGRVLLAFASPIFNPSGMSDANGIAERWDAAYEANLEAKNIAISEGHGLYEDFSKIFIAEDNKEAIFIRKYTTGLSTHRYEDDVRPPSVKDANGAASPPTWDIVQAFPMQSGLPIDDPSSGYDQEAYWANRDPRLYATIGYNSVPWKFKGRDDERQWTYVGNAQENKLVPATGFYLKKHVNTDISMVETVATPTDWIEIRFAEVLLNLAESANEAGRSEEAYAELRAIRARAGIDEGTGNYGIASGLSKADLRAVIMNERLIELAYENKRFWDLKRRNMYANGVNGEEGQGLTGTKRQIISTVVDTDYIRSINPGLDSASNPSDSAFMFFENVLLDTVNWDNPTNYANYFNTNIFDWDSNDINFLQPKYNFGYLPFNALVKNKNLRQTIGWLDEQGEMGTFDPLAE